MTDFDLGRYQDPLTIQRVLHTARTIAIVGLSNNQLRASYFVGYYLKRHGYQVIPVNPRETEILGEKSYPSLLDVFRARAIGEARAAATGQADHRLASMAWSHFGLELLNREVNNDREAIMQLDARRGSLRLARPAG